MRSVALIADRLVRVVSLAVRKEIVDDHADHREEEDDESPDHLVGDGAVRLEDLDWSTNTSAWVREWHALTAARQQSEQVEERHLLQAMISRTRTITRCEHTKLAYLSCVVRAYALRTSNNTASGASLPRLRSLRRNRCCFSKHEQRELEEDRDNEVEHCDGNC